MTNLTFIFPFFIFFKCKYFGLILLGIVGRDNISITLKAIALDIKPLPNHTAKMGSLGCIYFYKESDASFKILFKWNWIYQAYP